MNPAVWRMPVSDKVALYLERGKRSDSYLSLGISSSTFQRTPTPVGGVSMPLNPHGRPMKLEIYLFKKPQGILASHTAYYRATCAPRCRSRIGGHDRSSQDISALALFSHSAHLRRHPEVVITFINLSSSCHALTMVVKHEITLYDVRSTLNPPAWSPNVWKTRFILNYKRIAYTTCWLSYPDIGEVLPAVGVPPTRTQKPFYTVPSIVDQTDGLRIALSDSANIAMYLEKTHPLPPIFPEADPGVQLDYIDVIEAHVYAPMIFMTVPSTTRILEGRDLDYYLDSREEFLGIALEDMFPPHKQPAIWQSLEEGLDKLASLIDSLPRRGRHRRWLFSATDGPGYADFVLGAIFCWFEKAGPMGAWNRIRYRNGGKWEHLVEGLQPFSKVL